MAAPTILPFGDAAIAETARAILAGEPVAVPTETVYGLAADATNADAVARIYAAKGRPSFNPLIVHVPDRAAAERIAVFDGDATALADAFWPGPLTLVLPLRDDSGIASLVTAGLGTVAIRVPAHRAMKALLAAIGRPLAAPSANASGAISPTRAEHVAKSLGGRVRLIIDDGATARGLESTIVKDGRVLRPGPITAEQIAAAMPLAPFVPSDVERQRLEGTIPQGVAASLDTNGTGQPVAPGQLASHYAPSKPLRLNAVAAEPDEWLIGFGAIEGDDTLSARGDLTEAAARLFDALHHADASSKPRIAVAPIRQDGLGAAINDRLNRAAHQMKNSFSNRHP